MNPVSAIRSVLLTITQSYIVLSMLRHCLGSGTRGVPAVDLNS